MKSLVNKLLVTLFCFFVPVTLALAQGFQFVPLVGIPGVTDRTGGGGLSGYLNAIYRLSIALAALLAVLVLIKGGVKYMFSDIVSTKADAKSDIRGAILGLLLIMSAVLILSTINSNITNFEISIEAPDPAPVRPPVGGGGTLSLEQEICAMEGGCSRRPCSDLGNTTWQLVATGAALGSVIPGLGTGVGALVGGASAFAAHLAGNAASCLAVCSWLNGTIVNASVTNSGTCVYPNSGIDVEINRISEEMDRQEAACEGRFIRGVNARCIGVTDETTQDYLDDQLSELPDTNREQIEQRIRELVLDVDGVDVVSEGVVNDIRTELSMTTEDDLVLVFTAPTNITDLSAVEGQMGGICRDLNSEYTRERIGNQDYLLCVRLN